MPCATLSPVLEQVWVERAAQSEEFFMANLTLSFAAALTFMWAADFKSVVESPRMALVSTLVQNSSTSGILMPGGSWTSRDGVTISDPENQLRAPANVFVEPLNPASVAELIDENRTPVKFFRIGANPYVSGRDGSFHLSFPLPQDEPISELKKYSVLGLFRDEEATAEEGKDVMAWYSFSNYDDIGNKRIHGIDGLLDDTVYAIVKSTSLH
jgi:hypothetical protein